MTVAQDAATRTPQNTAPDGSAPSRLQLAVARQQPVGQLSQRVGRIALEFGLPLWGREVTFAEQETVLVGPGRIVLLLGPSGSGKTTVLNRIAAQFATARIIRGPQATPDPCACAPPHNTKCPRTRHAEPRAAGTAVIDTVAPWAPLNNAIATLTACGLGDANLWIRPHTALSDGERFRAHLARAVALNERERGVAPLLCDEFCSTLHRRSAKAISFNLRKLATRRGLSIVVASSNDDIVNDLNPDAIVRFFGSGRCMVDERGETAAKSASMRQPISLRRGLRIERGSKRDYDAFAAMHYRATDELGFVDKVFVLRDRRGHEPLGIVVYAHGPLELSLRNQATDGLFVRNPAAVNAHFRMLRRLVIHPDVRGCGLGHYLVRRTLPRVGTEYVECLAAMGEHNPVFEKAGMKRVGQYSLSPKRTAALQELQAMDVDPSAADFVTHVARRRSVRQIVARAVFEWYESTTAGGSQRVHRQSPELLAQSFRGLIASRPVYYIWKRKTRTVGPKCDKCKMRRRDARTNPYERPAQRHQRQERADSPPRAQLVPRRHNPF